MRSRRSKLLFRRLLVVAVAALAVVMVAACSGTIESNDAVGVAAPPGTEVGPVVVAPIGSPTSVAGDTAAFCQDLERLQTLLPALLEPQREAATLGQLKGLLSRIEADAPADIRPAVTQVRQTEDQLIGDLTAIPPNLADIGRTYRNPAFQQALQQLGLYAVNRC